MMENKELGIKVAEDTDEAFWTDQKEKCEVADKAELRNSKVRAKLLELCAEELS